MHSSYVSLPVSEIIMQMHFKATCSFHLQFSRLAAYPLRGFERGMDSVLVLTRGADS